MVRETDKPEKDYLRPEDRILWETVAKTAKPLIKPTAKQDELPDFKSLMAEEEKRPAKAKVQPALEASKPKKGLSALSEMQIQSLDKPTHRKIAKGRVDIEARIDLHGLTQEKRTVCSMDFWSARMHAACVMSWSLPAKAVHSAAKGFCGKPYRTGSPHRCSGFW